MTLGVSRPADPGVAAWFPWDGEQRCIPVDRYQSVEGNLQAIHHIIEARRVELRHGTLALVRASFKGFTPLLPPGPRQRTWREVLEIDTVPADRITPETVEHAHRRLMKVRHPDAGGSTKAAAELNAARDAALKELK